MTAMDDIRGNLRDISEDLTAIRASVRCVRWMSGLTLAFMIVLTWRAFQ